MQRASKAFLALTLFAVVALSGCFGGDDDGGASPTTTQTGTTATGTSSAPTSSPTSTSTNTGTSGPDKEHELTFSSDATGGDVPLNVTFTAEVTATEGGSDAEPDDFTWTLSFGDGTEDAEGDQGDFPLTQPHQYNAAGNYTAVLTATFEDGSSQSAEIQIQAELGEDPQEPPQTTFELGPTLGCTGDDAAGTCLGIVVAVQSGDVRTIDGHFISLDERYWGADMVMTATAGGQAIPDTDCYFLDDDFAIIGNGHNLADVCTGVVPNGTAWTFVFPYGVPAEEVLVEFTL